MTVRHAPKPKPKPPAPAIFREAYEVVLAVYRVVPGFPKGQRFVLGQRIEAEAVDVLAHVIEANMSRIKTARLKEASLSLERLRVFLRLAKDLSFLDFKRYETLSEKIDLVGRMLGGWTKWAKENAGRGKDGENP